jgi:hypothetical protein
MICVNCGKESDKGEIIIHPAFVCQKCLNTIEELMDEAIDEI